jgi:outer membrane protein OmpA-like peptidoglycan-associated protein
MVEPARPKTLTVQFNANSSALTPASRSALSTLSKELVKGASITVTGFAKGNAKLAKSRATSVASYLSGKDKTHATIRTVTGSAANAVTVATTKQ